MKSVILLIKSYVWLKVVWKIIYILIYHNYVLYCIYIKLITTNDKSLLYSIDWCCVLQVDRLLWFYLSCIWTCMLFFLYIAWYVCYMFYFILLACFSYIFIITLNIFACWGAYVIVYCSYEIWIVFLSINYQNTSNEIFFNYNTWYCLLFLFLHLDSMVVMMICLLKRHHKSSKLCLFLTPLVFWRKTWSRKDDVDDGNNGPICILLVEPL